MDSGLFLNRRSYIPSFMKSIFVSNRINDVQRTCNTEEGRNVSLSRIKNTLTENRHTFNSDKLVLHYKNKSNYFLTSMKKWKNNNLPIIKLPFLNDKSWK